MAKKGFTIIELVVAIFILTVGTAAAFTLIHNTLTFSRISSSQLTAAYLAQEGIEAIRNIRDNNWLEQRTNPELAWDDGLTGDCVVPRIPPCDFYGDGNFDGIITEADVECDLFNECYGHYATGLCIRYDLNGSGVVDTTDFAIFAGYLNCERASFTVCDVKARFQRKITITESEANILNVSSKVSFQERGRTHQITAQEKLYQWR